jgi:hypothetical protein
MPEETFYVATFCGGGGGNFKSQCVGLSFHPSFAIHHPFGICPASIAQKRPSESCAPTMNLASSSGGAVSIGFHSRMGFLPNRPTKYRRVGSYIV